MRSTFRWAFPLLMLLLATIACDDPSYLPPMVRRVEADDQTAGRAYAEIYDESQVYLQASNPANSIGISIYMTDDYGQTWRRSDHAFSDETAQDYALQLRYETLMLSGVELWRLPRPTFRFFFNGDISESWQVNLGAGNISNSAHEDVVYVALGTQGVLVGPSPGSASNRPWQVTNTGIDAISPLTLRLTDPLEIVIVIGLALFVPPLPLLHAYLLSRVWIYLIPQREAWGIALRTSFALAVLAAAAIAFWLTHNEIDYYSIVGIMTVVVVIVGIGMTRRLAERSGVAEHTRRRASIASALVSLIVPAGVATVWAGWWLIIGLLLAYEIFRGFLEHDMHRQGLIDKTSVKREQRWQIDRLLLGTMAYLGAGMIAMFVAVTAAGGLGLILFAIGGIATARIIAGFIKGWMRSQMTVGDAPNATIRWGSALGIMIVWFAVAAITAVTIFYGQGMAYGLFNRLG